MIPVDVTDDSFGSDEKEDSFVKYVEAGVCDPGTSINPALF